MKNQFFRELANRHRWFLLSGLVLYVAFLYPLIFMQKAFVLHDYAVQTYPWLKLYAENLRAGGLTLWTPLIQNGFPLFAEGQAGMLYFPNWLLFRFLDFSIAYNATFLLHFFLGGLFSYLFALQRRLSPEASAITAVIFTFGSAYAGCMGNLIAMRVLVWLPLSLFFLEKYFADRRVFWFFLLGFVQGQAWLGGAPQSAMYSFFFIVCYFGLRLWEYRHADIRGIFYFGLATVISLLIGMPQLWATSQLAANSTRSLYGAGFALWGSTAPWSLLNLFLYPWTKFLQAPLFIGIAPLLLLLIVPAWRKARVEWILVVISFFLALGAFNPIYWLLVQIPGAAVLRNPSKFLFFTVFFISLCAGASFDEYFSRKQGPRGDLKRVGIASSLFLVIALGGWLLSHQFADELISYGRWYVERFILGKSYHKYPVEEYVNRLATIVTFVQTHIDLKSFFFWAPFASAGVFMWALGKPNFKKIFLVILLADLLVYGKFGFGSALTAQLGTFPDLRRQAAYESDGRWLELCRPEEAVFVPNTNMLTGHSQSGAYSPLLDRRYYLLTKNFNYLDDSLGRLPYGVSAVNDPLPLLSFLGIKYISAPLSLALTGFVPLRSESGRQIAMNPMARDELSLVSSARVIADEDAATRYLTGRSFDPAREAVIAEPVVLEDELLGEKNIRVLERRDEILRAHVENDRAALLVWAQTYSPGWKVWIDGRPGAIIRANAAFQAVRLSQGQHEVLFRFVPDYMVSGLIWHLLGLGLAIMGMLAAWFKPHAF